MELLKIWEEWAKKNGYTSLTQDGIIKTMVTEFCKHLESIPMQLPVKPACEKDIRIDELNKLQQTLNPYQMNENDFFRAMMDGTIKNTILMRINELSKSV